MVSFFGLKVGGRKKKPDGKPAAQEQQPQQRKRIDQNTLGEGQYFGRDLDRHRDIANGSIRSVSRAGTPQAGRGTKVPPYLNHDTHNLAAASMFDLSCIGPGRPGSQASFVIRPHASDANMRARFGANNGSSVSLVAPAPGFGARFGARNGSSASLTAPGPGFGSRPGTPSRTKAWVNPLDVHFARDVPTGPPTPKSPLVDSIHLPPTPTAENTDTGSVFGEEADDMVDAVIASVKKQEEEEKEAKRREAELEKQRETARLEMERLERQKSTESSVAERRPSAPQPEFAPEPEPNFETTLQKAPKVDADARPGTNGGPPRPHPVHQGPPPTGPPTQCLPQPPGRGPPRLGPLGPTRPLAPHANNNRSDGLAHNKPPQKTFRPYRPPALQGSGPLGLLSDGLRSPSPALNSPGIREMAHSPTLYRRPSFEHRPIVTNPEGDPPVSSGRGTPGPDRPEPGPLLTTLTSPSTATSPSGSIRRLSLDDEPVEQFARPIIQNVVAKRDTLTLNTPRQQSLSMKIEELEKTLFSAQERDPMPMLEATKASRTSTDSSLYSDGIKSEDEDDDDGPILSIQPAPLRIPPPMVPPALVPAVNRSQSPVINRPQSPMRGPPRRGPLPRRPALEEYGVSSTAVRARGGTPTPASRSGSTDNYSAHSSPPSRTHTPQLRHPNWRRDRSQPSPAPTLDTYEQHRPVVDTGFKFDFGPGPNLAAPPTPDSTTWSLASPVGDVGPAPPPPTSDPSQGQPSKTDVPKFTRANVPPPLNLDFNFSADAPSRDPNAGLWTPPIRSVPAAAPTADGRPSTSSGAGHGGSKLAASPSLISQFPESALAADDNRTSFMGIGMARGPSIKEVRRPKTSGGKRPGPGMVDSFGTGFI